MWCRNTGASEGHIRTRVPVLDIRQMSSSKIGGHLIFLAIKKAGKNVIEGLKFLKKINKVGCGNQHWQKNKN